MTSTRLVAFDLDGTLTRGQTCLQTLATAFGFADRMPIWGQARTDEEIRAAHAGVWEHLRHRTRREIAAALSGIPLAPGACEGIAALHRAGIRTVVVSLALASSVAYFAGRVGIEKIIAAELDDNGRFDCVFPATKPTLLAGHARALRVTPDQIAAVGDSVGDVHMLRSAQTSIYVGATLPDDCSPTWHLPAAPIDDIAHLILERH